MRFIDHLHRAVILPKPPERIISLVPSQTELLVELGLEDRLVGVTKFCVHPDRLRKQKTIVGGTKNYRFDVIDQLKPDLIIGNKEENDQAGIEQLSSLYPVWMSDIVRLEDSFRMISDLGTITGTELRALAILTKIEASLAKPMPFKGRCLYLIWNNPMMVAGKDTFIDEMLKLAGFENLATMARYPEMSEEELVRLDPEYVLLSSEPFPFATKHLEAFQRLLPRAEIQLVDGEMFSWYGSRLLYSMDYFRRL